jgi:hypothetical protein
MLFREEKACELCHHNGCIVSALLENIHKVIVDLQREQVNVQQEKEE